MRRSPKLHSGCTLVSLSSGFIRVHKYAPQDSTALYMYGAILLPTSFLSFALCFCAFFLNLLLFTKKIKLHLHEIFNLRFLHVSAYIGLKNKAFGHSDFILEFFEIFKMDHLAKTPLIWFLSIESNAEWNSKGNELVWSWDFTRNEYTRSKTPVFHPPQPSRKNWFRKSIWRLFMTIGVSEHMGRVRNVVLMNVYSGLRNPGGSGFWVGEGPDGKDGGNARVSLQAT